MSVGLGGNQTGGLGGGGAGWPPSWVPDYGMGGLPGMGGGSTGMMFQSLLQLIMQNTMGSAGLMPMGLSRQNMYDRMQAQYFTGQHNDLIRNMAQRDRPAIMQMWQGTARAFGQPWGADQFQAASALASAQIAASPMLVELAPMALDAMMGERGSAASMAHYMMRGGRNRLDPVSGRWGLDARSAEDLTTRVYDRLFTSRSVRDSFGLSAGEAGQLSWALQRQGRLPGGSLEGLEVEDPGFMRGAMRNVDLRGSVSGLSAGDRSLLMSGSGVQEKLRSFDAKRVSETLREWSGSIHAMREIFGDAGMPNAPMPMLMGALEQLTGGTAQFQPGRVQNMVRNTANLASMSGVGLQGAMMMQQAAMPMAQSLGLDPVFANMATQQMMAFTAGYGSQGMGAYRAWGSGSLGQLQQDVTQMSLGAAASQAGNQMGALLRLERMGSLSAGSDASRLIDAMRMGSTRFTDASGQVRSLDLSAQEYASMVAGSTGGRIGQGEALYMLRQGSANQELLTAPENASAVTTITRLQRDDFARDATVTMGSAARVRLAASGFGDQFDAKDAAVLGRLLGRAGQQAFYGAAPGVAHDPALLREAMAGNMMRALRAKAAGGGPQSVEAQQVIDRAEADPNFLQSISGIAFAEWDQRLRDTGRGTARRNYVALNDNVLQDAARTTAQSQIDTNMQNAMAPLGGRNMVRRAVEAVMRIKPGDEGTMWKVAGKILGGEDKAEMEELMRPELAKLMDLGEQYRAKAREIQQLPPGEERQKVWTEAEMIAKQIGEFTTEMDDRFKAAGFDLNSVMDAGQFVQFQRQSAQIDKLMSQGADLSKETHGMEVFSVERANAREMRAQYYSSPREAARMGMKGLKQVRTSKDMDDAIDVLAQRTGKSVQQLGVEGNVEFLGMRDLRNAAMAGLAEMVGKSGYSDFSEEQMEDLNKLAAATGLSVETLLEHNPDNARQAGYLRDKFGDVDGLDVDRAMKTMRGAYGTRQAFRDQYSDEVQSFGEQGKRAATAMLGALPGSIAYEDFAKTKQWQNFQKDIRGGTRRGRMLIAAMHDITAGANRWDEMGADEKKLYQDTYGNEIFGQFALENDMASQEGIMTALERVRQGVPEERSEGDPERRLLITTDKIVINMTPEGGAEIPIEGKEQ